MKNVEYFLMMIKDVKERRRKKQESHEEVHSHGLNVTIGLIPQIVQVTGLQNVFRCVGFELEYDNKISHDVVD